MRRWLTIAAVLMIPAALLFPYRWASANHDAQRRTMANLRTLSTALGAYAMDHDAYPQVHSCAELRAVLAPKYIRSVPCTDEWGHAIAYNYDARRPRPDSYDPHHVWFVIGSPGRDGRFSALAEPLFRATGQAVLPPGLHWLSERELPQDWYNVDLIVCNDHVVSAPPVSSQWELDPPPPALAWASRAVALLALAVTSVTLCRRKSHGSVTARLQQPRSS